MRTEKKMVFETNAKDGKVVDGTFSKRVNGMVYPTPEAFAIVLEAFQMDGSTHEEQNFSRETREALSEKYGILVNTMILLPIQNFVVRKTARKGAWMIYSNEVKLGKNCASGAEIK